MTYSSYDSRETIRQTIGTARWTEAEGDFYCIEVEATDGSPIYVPMWLAEETRTTSLKELPYIKMTTVMTSYLPEDINARTRYMESHIDLNVYFTNTDEIIPADFAKKIKDNLQNLIRTKQVACAFPASINFINIEDERYIEEPKAQQVVFHWILSLYVTYHDY